MKNLFLTLAFVVGTFVATAQSKEETIAYLTENLQKFTIEKVDGYTIKLISVNECEILFSEKSKSFTTKLSIPVNNAHIGLTPECEDKVLAHQYYGGPELKENDAEYTFICLQKEGEKPFKTIFDDGRHMNFHTSSKILVIKPKNNSTATITELNNALLHLGTFCTQKQE